MVHIFLPHSKCTMYYHAFQLKGKSDFISCVAVWLKCSIKLYTECTPHTISEYESDCQTSIAVSTISVWIWKLNNERISGPGVSLSLPLQLIVVAAPCSCSDEPLLLPLLMTLRAQRSINIINHVWCESSHICILHVFPFCTATWADVQFKHTYHHYKNTKRQQDRSHS